MCGLGDVLGVVEGGGVALSLGVEDDFGLGGGGRDLGGDVLAEKVPADAAK